MGKPKPKQEVNEYYMSMHTGVCVTVDALTHVTMGDKVAWSGEVTANGDVAINQRQLFGGPKKEGGVAGIMSVLLGKPDQVLPDELAIKLGRASGADCPGFRGVLSLFFTGKQTSLGLVGGLIGVVFSKFGFNQPGFYWTANTPYLKNVAIGVQRIYQSEWYPAKAAIPTGSGTVDPIDLSSEFPQLTSGNPAYPVPPSFYPHSIILGPYSQNAEIVAGDPDGSGFCNPDDFFYFNGVQLGTSASPTYSAGTVLFSLAAGNTVTIQVKNTINPYSGVIGSFHVRFTGGDRLDMNPSHIIRECLVNTEWGMGAPESILDTDSFTAAADTLYGEGLGLSLRWTQQDTIENFVTEIIDHIQATLFVNPRTGLLTLKLIRDDYDPDTLREINPDNADLDNFQRKGWGEIVNEVIVTWTNPENEQDETVTVHDLGAIAAQNGKVISTSRNYYGVRSSALAMQLAHRDLRSSAFPLASCDVELDRSAWDLLPGDVVKITWPEYGLAGVVMRVGPVDYGNLGNPVIRASLVEDVFGLAVAEYEQPTGSEWVSDDTDPEPVTYSRIITAPAFLAAKYLAEAGITSAIEYPEVLSGVLGSSDNGVNFDLWGPTVLADGSTVEEVQATCTMLGHATLADTLGAEASSTGVTLSDFIGTVFPGVGIVMLIGDNETTEEITMITAESSGAYTINRGLLDTVPRDWAAGSTVWLFSIDSDISDIDFKSDGETVSYKLLTRTFSGVLDPSAAPVLSNTMTGRPHYPNRPVNVTAHGLAWSSINNIIDASQRSNPWVTVTWANRNRLTEDTQILTWTDATVTPETGQTTTIEVRDVDGNLLTTHDDLSGTSFDVPDASFGTEAVVELRTMAKRTDADGTFTSLQHFSHWVQVVPGIRRTEAAETRMTESGEIRITED